ncbi:SAC3/GANP/Nin1/mts3/eIF-3 p25 family [Abeliophyllum distichum]|uniref:SAC3/GANP/Nin1/mts3/eIF-3 p25 family n=1 Tax=Abeliophyllum distichum TaxID=126358 RepID=A0ABD1UM50_9LAMI
MSSATNGGAALLGNCNWVLKNVNEVMMNQGETTETITTLDPNSLEKHQAVDQVHASSYYPPNPAVASWSTHGENHNLRENGTMSNPSYQHDQRVEPISRNVQDGMNIASTASTSNSGVANVAQGYSGYATYPNSDPYGYNSSGYAGYYSGYQQQSNQYQQQSNQYQQQSSQYQQQQSNQYQQQSNQSYPQPIGAYQNTGAPYQPLSSFQNTGSYTGPASYSSTYYNPGDYQTSGSYTSGTYGAQTNLWHGGQYAEYSSNQYPSYKPETNTAYSSTTAVATSQYQQQYKQWSDYYNQSQTEVSCAPGTENLSVSSASNLSCSVPSASGGYSASNSQLPVPYTPSWRPESSSSESTPLKPGVASGSTHEGYWKQGTPAFQDNYSNSQPPHVQNSLDANPTYGSFQTQQQSTFSHGSSMLYPASHPVSQSSFQTVSQPLDSRRVGKLQIPTNPRIASNLALGLPKTDKDSTTTSTDSKPAYVSVSMPKPNEKALSHDADSMLKPGVFPNSLRGYVERAFARCKDDVQKAACQSIMKEVITKATAEGTLYTRDWDTEPLFPLPDADAVNNEDAQFLTPISSPPKNKRSPSRRAKSRWEPIPEEKVVDKSANLSYGTVKYGGWNKQFSAGKSENKENTLSTKFSFPKQKALNKNATRPAKRQRLSNGLNAAVDGETSSDSDKEQSLTAYYSAAVALADSPEEKKRRENRSKRFEKGRGSRQVNNQSKAKKMGASNFYVRQASAVVLGKSFEEKGSRAVEDIDWDALTVKGTCQEIEKRYLRLTSAPDPATVRPEEVLEKALLMVQNSEKNYLYKCDQLKSIRQDLTVQHIRNELTAKVYETHARLAIEVGDLPEYNQCQSQLSTLYLEGIKGCHMEFAAYNLLCVLLHSSNNRDLLSAMSRLSAEAKKNEAVKHALSVRAAMSSGNYVMFFRLYKTAPNLNSCLMDLHAEKMRYAAIRCMSRSYRPTVPVSYIAQILGFANLLLTTEASDEKDVDGVEECVEWLKAHGGCLTSDNSGEMLLDTKVSASSLYMPEPEDAVAHGDASLAVNDFLTRSLA